MKTLTLKQLKTDPAEKDQIRNIKAALAQGDTTGSQAYENEGGHGGTRLPPLARGQQYLEYQLGSANDGSRGQHRLVVLYGPSTRYQTLYYTGDHYMTFVELL